MNKYNLQAHMFSLSASCRKVLKSISEEQETEKYIKVTLKVKDIIEKLIKL